jgi:hypothetical protein
MHLHREHRSANALRVSRAKQRRRSGLRVFHIEADEISVADMLVTAKILDPEKVDDPAAVASALQKMIGLLCRETTL